ncbi:MAG: hypothetical protein FJ318_08110 [SAR202 cluster bacterium]|nr:hypothetical protein [SAR202 cluster bacterium]
MLTEFQIRHLVHERLANPSSQMLVSLQAISRERQCGAADAWHVYEDALYIALAAEAHAPN